MWLNTASSLTTRVLSHTPHRTTLPDPEPRISYAYLSRRKRALPLKKPHVKKDGKEGSLILAVTTLSFEFLVTVIGIIFIALSYKHLSPKNETAPPMTSDS